MNRKRGYHSELRADQAAATRARIVEAAAESFASWTVDRPFDKVPFGKVAERARVSVRTVFRYFPTQDDLIEAASLHIEQASGWDPDATRAENVGAKTAHAFTYFGSLIDRSAPGPEEDRDKLREGYRAKRAAAVEGLLAPYTEGLDDELARGVCAVFAGLMRIQFFRAMHDQWGLDGTQAGCAVEWAMNALIDALRNKKEDEGCSSKAVNPESNAGWRP